MLLDLLFIVAGVAICAEKKVSYDTERELERKYVASKGYNKPRQDELERMCLSADPNRRAEFIRILGHTINVRNWWEREDALREIAAREGWTYYDISELSRDPTYRRIIHAPRKRRY